MILRDATAADMPAIQTIYADAVLTGTASFEIDPPDAAEITRRWGAITAAGGPYLVAAEGGDILGYCYAGPYRPRPAYRFTLEDSVYVAPGQGGRGIGAALLARAIEIAEARDFRQMLAVIGDSENRASRQLHARLGFRNVGVFRAVGFKHGRWLDTVLMQRPLGPGDMAAPRLTAGDPPSM
ncbi:MAG: GNAT family N-acetyltransferase [Paracoccaceae bacterium]|nr:GNAT family N-acetyltransferase [Paracoccaceae bacterium]